MIFKRIVRLRIYSEFNLFRIQLIQKSKEELVFKKRRRSKVVSDKRFLVGLKICPPVLNNRSTEADDGNAVLYLKNMRKISGCLKIPFVSVSPS